MLRCWLWRSCCSTDDGMVMVVDDDDGSDGYCDVAVIVLV